MPVREATEGVGVEPNTVYLIPPNTVMTLVDGKLGLSPRPTPRAPHMPIDHLFRSLAEIQKNRAVGVILSGGGTDGTLGFQAIKAEGGITFAQDEKSARHASMPRAAALDGFVDYVLPPADIARQLAQLARHAYARGELPEDEAGAGDEGNALARVLDLVRAGTGANFANYKRTTVKRRVQRRMALLGVDHLTDYLRHLEGDPHEVHRLYQDLLIRVTRFFRDPEVFETLQDKVFPVITKNRSADNAVRIWVAGCATGEEVYSLAIALLEFLGDRARSVPVKILATDINEAALEKARAGTYVDNIELDVSPERLRRFFALANGHYQISKAVRELCVFSRHNMASDPPFSRIDLLSCRNVLIYMDLALQRRVLPAFHYALNPGGFLVLGTSENIGAGAELFSVVDHPHRLFAKNAVASRPDLALGFGSYAAAVGEGRSFGHEGGRMPWSAVDAQREADRIVLSKYSPVGVVVDEGLNVLQFRGRTGPYLEPAPGLASLDLLKMLREGLLVEVRAAVTQARAENAPVRKEGLSVVERGHFRRVNVEVIPFKVPPSDVRCLLVLFEDQPGPPAAPAPAAPAEAAAPQAAPAEAARVAQLQQELASLREHVQSIQEEHDVTSEELKSASEEILSANEELQSTNEELQTAKEETQSANEELATVNDELRHRNLELAQANNDLVNLLAGVNIPILMVSRDLRIRRFTSQAENLLNLIPTDVGRPISDIRPNINVTDLAQVIAGVIDSLTPHESEIQDREGHWYSLRVRPYVTLDNKIDGASIVLVDIDSVKRGTQAEGQATSSG
jgi:two-component system CheB/CheR fusion protein